MSERRRIEHKLAAFCYGLKGDARRALYHAVLAEGAEPSDFVLTEQALALEQMGMRRLAWDVWGIVRRRNPGMGSWRIVTAAFLRGDEKAIRKMERWRSRPERQG